MSVRRLAPALAMVLFLPLLLACVEKEKAVEKEAPAVREKVGIPIAQVLERAASYQGTEVTVAGEVSPGLAFEFVDEQPYGLDDGTARIWVVTRGVMPEEGAWVTVRGTVMMPYQIKGRRFGIAIVETERRQ